MTEKERLDLMKHHETTKQFFDKGTIKKEKIRIMEIVESDSRLLKLFRDSGDFNYIVNTLEINSELSVVLNVIADLCVSKEMLSERLIHSELNKTVISTRGDDFFAK